MDVRNLSGDTPANAAWESLADLIARRGELTAAVDRLDHDQRAAGEAARRASAAVADLQRRTLGGETIPASRVKTAEQELSRARSRASEPWQERRQGATAAIVDADRAISTFVIGRFDDLVAGLVAQGEQAAQAIDDAAARLLQAHAERAAIANRMSSLASLVRAVRPGDVSRSRAERAAHAAQALLDGGGEVPPSLRHDPRQPRHSQPEPGVAETTILA